MTALFVGLTTLDVLHRLDHAPDPFLRVMSAEFTMAAGDPVTNAATTYAALCAASHVVSDPEGETGAASGAPANSEGTPVLLATLNEGPVSAFLAADLAVAGVRVVGVTIPASPPASREPIVSLIIEHPSGRMVVSTNAQFDADAERMVIDLSERVDVVLIGGYNPALAYTALTLGVPEVNGEGPFVPLEACPSHSRILDGGSWKERLTLLLDFVDITIVPKNFTPPLTACPDGAQVAEPLRGFGVMRTMRTCGDRTVQYWWGDTSGEIPVEAIPDASTLGAGDAFHGVFV